MGRAGSGEQTGDDRQLTATWYGEWSCGGLNAGGRTQMRFWNSTPRILMGLNRSGTLSPSAVPDGGYCAGVKYETPGAGGFWMKGAIAGRFVVRICCGRIVDGCFRARSFYRTGKWLCTRDVGSNVAGSIVNSWGR